MPMYYRERAQFDQASATLDSNSEEAWQETKKHPRKELKVFRCTKNRFSNRQSHLPLLTKRWKVFQDLPYLLFDLSWYVWVAKLWGQQPIATTYCIILHYFAFHLPLRRVDISYFPQSRSAKLQQWLCTEEDEQKSLSVSLWAKKHLAIPLNRIPATAQIRIVAASVKNDNCWKPQYATAWLDAITMLLVTFQPMVILRATYSVSVKRWKVRPWERNHVILHCARTFFAETVKSSTFHQE